MKILPKIFRIHDRDIIRVEVREGYIQPFYKSTGRSSKKKNAWLPFDGLLCWEGQVIWFDKGRYSVKDASGYRLDLHRYGTEELREVSDKLATMDIPKGTEASAREINEWLGYGI